VTGVDGEAGEADDREAAEEERIAQDRRVVHRHPRLSRPPRRL
jgi:hypothetical protein